MRNINRNVPKRNTASTRPTARSKSAFSTDRINQAHGEPYHNHFIRVKSARIFCPLSMVQLCCQGCPTRSINISPKLYLCNISISTEWDAGIAAIQIQRGKRFSVSTKTQNKTNRARAKLNRPCSVFVVGILRYRVSQTSWGFLGIAYKHYLNLKITYFISRSMDSA